jgi:hypothetical protein
MARFSIGRRIDALIARTPSALAEYKDAVDLGVGAVEIEDRAVAVELDAGIAEAATDGLVVSDGF